MKIMTDPKMVEFRAKVSDELEYPLEDYELDEVREYYLLGFLPFEVAETLQKGTFPDRFINVLEV